MNSPPGEALLEAVSVRKKFCRRLDRSLRYGVQDLVTSALGRPRPAEKLRAGEFWALADVTFRLEAGECLGIVGPNGAGKSTLLKLLNGRLPLDGGRITVRGRLRAISELGIGFDPVLTGRENIFHEATLLGQSADETEKHLEAILDFAGIGDFVDAPVLTYSTGMRARLGFAIAVHLEPDILLLDELLAVGDLHFRRQCVRHMMGLIEAGAGIILVSHDLYTVQNLCSRTLYLDGGEVVDYGPSDRVVKAYLASDGGRHGRSRGEEQPGPAAPASAARPLSTREPVIIDRLEILPITGDTLRTGEVAEVHLHYRSRQARPEVFWGFRVATADLMVQITSGLLHAGERPAYALAEGSGVLRCRIPNLPLLAGTYALRGAIAEPDNGALIALFGHDQAPTLFAVEGRAHPSENFHRLSGDLVAVAVERPDSEDVERAG
ncbi:MAG: polysaccharide ABC transporter ATP-binding protein [Acidobacteriota bacterium]